MEITGKIIQALEPRGGVSQRTGNPWKSQTFVIETAEQYPRHCAFDVFGEDKLKEFDIKVGELLTVSFDIDAHEYQGRWYNSIRAWRVQRGDVAPAGVAAAPQAQTIPSPTAPAPAAPTAAPMQPAAGGTDDDLPF